MYRGNRQSARQDSMAAAAFTERRPGQRVKDGRWTSNDAGQLQIPGWRWIQEEDMESRDAIGLWMPIRLRVSNRLDREIRGFGTHLASSDEESIGADLSPTPSGAESDKSWSAVELRSAEQRVDRANERWLKVRRSGIMNDLHSNSVREKRGAALRAASAVKPRAAGAPPAATPRHAPLRPAGKLGTVVKPSAKLGAAKPILLPTPKHLFRAAAEHRASYEAARRAAWKPRLLKPRLVTKAAMMKAAAAAAARPRVWAGM